MSISLATPVLLGFDETYPSCTGILVLSIFCGCACLDQSRASSNGPRSKKDQHLLGSFGLLAMIMNGSSGHHDAAVDSSTSTYRPGDPVLTVYGCGVIVDARNDNGRCSFGVRLWRIPGKSIGSAAMAHLQSSSVSVLFSCCAGIPLRMFTVSHCLCCYFHC
jgi:hypothetical protein